MIIGISGKKQSGKDTICNIIRALDIWDRRDELNIWTSCKTREEFAKEFVWENTMFLEASKWKKHAFADKLKQMASTLLDVPIEYWEDGEFKNDLNPSGLTSSWGRTYTNREILQVVGNTLREYLDPNVWVNTLFKGYTVYPSKLVNSEREKVGNWDESCNGIPTVNNEYPWWIIPDVRMPNEVEAVKALGGVLIRVNKACEEFDRHISETALDDYTEFDYVVENNGTIEELITKVIEIYDLQRIIRVSPNNE